MIDPVILPVGVVNTGEIGCVFDCVEQLKLSYNAFIEQYFLLEEYAFNVLPVFKYCCVSLLAVFIVDEIVEQSFTVSRLVDVSTGSHVSVFTVVSIVVCEESEPKPEPEPDPDPDPVI